MTEIDRLKEKLLKLHLKGMAQQLDTVLRDAGEKNNGILHSLCRLADHELERRHQGAIKLRWDQAKIPGKVSIDRFDFRPSQDKKGAKEPNPQLARSGVYTGKRGRHSHRQSGHGENFPGTMHSLCCMQRQYESSIYQRHRYGQPTDRRGSRPLVP